MFVCLPIRLSKLQKADNQHLREEAGTEPSMLWERGNLVISQDSEPALSLTEHAITRCPPMQANSSGCGCSGIFFAPLFIIANKMTIKNLMFIGGELIA